MKILLAQRLPCFPAFAGETKLNRALLEALAERHHVCRMVALAMPYEGADALENLRRAQASRGILCDRSSEGADVYSRRGVDVHVVPDGYHLWTCLSEQIQQFEPDCVLIAQDRTFVGLATAVTEAGPSRVVFLAHSQPTLPFGPESFSPDAAKTEVLKQAGHIVASSHYIANYIWRWSGLTANVLSIPVYGRGPFRHLGHPEQGFVTLVNPSGLKGVSIFEALAKSRPDVGFAAVPTWATLESDFERLRRLPNVRVLKPAEDIDEILAQTRILLVPSLWGEGFGLLVVEAMLRGIPVLASNVGGLPEAKMGVDYLLPVRRIEEYRDQADERGLPIPIIPPQNIDPWLEALDRLIADPPYYRQLSNTSRATAMAAISALDITPIEAFLEAVSAGRDDIGRSRQRSTTTSADDGAATVSAAAGLSRDRLELLVTLLRRDRA